MYIYIACKCKYAQDPNRYSNCDSSTIGSLSIYKFEIYEYGLEIYYYDRPFSGRQPMIGSCNSHSKLKRVSIF